MFPLRRTLLLPAFLLLGLLLNACGAPPSDSGNGTPAVAVTVAPAAGHGQIDSSFGAGGKLTTAVGVGGDEAHAVAIQADGKIVAAGSAYQFVESRNENRQKFALARYNADGSLDTTFGQGGLLIQPMIDDDIDGSWANALAIQPDGKILAAGTAVNLAASKNTFAIARFNPDGSLDTSFGDGGRVLTKISNGTGYNSSDEILALALAADGKIVAAGKSGDLFSGHLALARYNATGSLDGSFGAGGIVYREAAAAEEAHAVAIAPDGKIAFAGMRSNADNDDFLVGRFNADGTPDATFGDGGFTATEFVGGDDQAQGIVLRPDGKIVVAGWTTLGSPTTCGPDRELCERIGIGLAQYAADGRLDSSFGNAGKVGADFGFSTYGNALLRLDDGSLLVGGSVRTSDFALARYTDNGSLDKTFGDAGLARLNFAPAVDSGDRVYGIARQADGNVVLAGIGAVDDLGIKSDFALARYLP